MSSDDGFEGIRAIRDVLMGLIEMHILGFAVKRLELLGTTAEEGLAAYVYTIGLPALLFSSIATQLTFSDIDIVLVSSILIAKFVLTALGIAVAQLATREGDGTGFAARLGGITVLLATMSDDVGTGIPVFTAFFSKEQGPWVTLHLVILSAAQAFLINPLAYVLLGVGRARSELQAKADSVLEAKLAEGLSPSEARAATMASVPNPDMRNIVIGVIKGFRKNMLVLSVLAGGTVNLIRGPQPLPNWLSTVSEMAGSAFLPLVMLVGGMSLSSSFGHLASLRLAVLPTMLVTLKTIILPILATFILHSFMPDASQSVRDFTFFYGVLPVATAALAIVRSYKVDDDMLSSISTSLFLGKVLSFALYILGAYLITPAVRASMMMSSFASLSDLMHGLSIAGGGYMLVMAWRDAAYRPPHMWTCLCLVTLQTAFSAVFLVVHFFALYDVESRVDMPRWQFSMCFFAVSTLRWASFAWLLVMCFDQCCRSLVHTDEPWSWTKPSTWLARTPQRPPRTTPDSAKRRISFDEKFYHEDPHAAFGSTRKSVYVLVAILFAAINTLPFLPLTHRMLLQQNYRRVNKGRYPIDTVLWVPYTVVSHQGTAYMSVYCLSALIIITCLLMVLHKARKAERAQCDEQPTGLCPDDDARTLDDRLRAVSSASPASPPRMRSASHDAGTPADVPPAPEIAAADSFIKPVGEVTLHVRVQLLAVLLLLRCICQIGVLVALKQDLMASANFSLVDHPDVVAFSLLTIVWILLEDGQAFLTFLLIATAAPFPPPTSLFASAPAPDAAPARPPPNFKRLELERGDEEKLRAAYAHIQKEADAVSPAMLRFTGIPSQRYFAVAANSVHARVRTGSFDDLEQLGQQGQQESLGGSQSESGGHGRRRMSAPQSRAASTDLM